MATLYLTSQLPPTPAVVAAVVGVASTAVTVTSTRGLYIASMLRVSTT